MQSISASRHWFRIQNFYEALRNLILEQTLCDINCSGYNRQIWNNENCYRNNNSDDVSEPSYAVVNRYDSRIPFLNAHINYERSSQRPG